MNTKTQDNQPSIENYVLFAKNLIHIHFNFCAFVIYLFWEKVSYSSPDWSQTPYVVENGLNFWFSFYLPSAGITRIYHHVLLACNQLETRLFFSSVMLHNSIFNNWGDWGWRIMSARPIHTKEEAFFLKREATQFMYWTKCLLHDENNNLPQMLAVTPAKKKISALNKLLAKYLHGIWLNKAAGILLVLILKFLS